MAACLRVPMATSRTCSSSSSESIKRRSFSAQCAVKVVNKAKMPMPPMNPRDSFLSRLAAVATNSPEKLVSPPADTDRLPYVDLVSAPILMAAPAQVERSASYNGHRTRRPPPDLPSILLNGRVVYIGMPFVPAVTELIVAELMYLQWADPKAPIYLYINSTGTTRADGETVAMETEGFAIYDALMQMKCEIYTLGLGQAVGQACLLLAAGTKGKRFMLPNAHAMIEEPNMPSLGLMQATDVDVRVREMAVQRDIFVKLLAKHTGNSVETIAKAIKYPFYMNWAEAKEFGVIDQVYSVGQEYLMSEYEGLRPRDEM